MKTCGKCHIEKPLTEFYPRWLNGKPRAHNSICKDCAKAGALAWAKENKEAHRKNTGNWARENKEKHAASVSKWSKSNMPKRNQAFAARRFSKKNATPKWRNQFFMEEIYRLAELRTKHTGIDWEVDHIVPLQSPIVCGLHVEHNLQVIPGIQNRRKHNRIWPDMP